MRRSSGLVGGLAGVVLLAACTAKPAPVDPLPEPPDEVTPSPSVACPPEASGSPSWA